MKRQSDARLQSSAIYDNYDYQEYEQPVQTHPLAIWGQKLAAKDEVAQEQVGFRFEPPTWLARPGSPSTRPAKFAE